MFSIIIKPSPKQQPKVGSGLPGVRAVRGVQCADNGRTYPHHQPTLAVLNHVSDQTLLPARADRPYLPHHGWVHP